MLNTFLYVLYMRRILFQHHFHALITEQYQQTHAFLPLAVRCLISHTVFTSNIHFIFD